MNIKALQRAFTKEAMRLVEGFSKQDLYKPMDAQIDRSLKRLQKEYEREAKEDRPIIKETGPSEKTKQATEVQEEK